MAEPNVGSGDISITLDGEEYVLRPTANAALVISRQSGGLRGAIDSVLRLDMDVIVRVIQAGLGQQVSNKMKDLDVKVFKSGLTDQQGGLVSKCVEFLHILANGGRPLDTEGDGDKGNGQS